jgi:hypothetical protein
MGNSSPLPVGRFSPSRGIVVDRAQKSVAIRGAMEIHGPAATGSNARAVQTAINTAWTATFPDGYAVVCTITVNFRGPASKAGNATQIEALTTTGPSYVAWGTRGRYITLNAKEPTAFGWTAAHEFGHIIGLQDRYSESIMSKLSGFIGGNRITAVQNGYNGNIMAVHGGALWSKNLADLAVENEPSPYWINDDDYVAEWVNHHSVSEVGRLATSNKIRALHTLLSAWVSLDDMTAIKRICASVSSTTEAAAIRKAIDALALTDIGQRTTIRIALAQMP